RDRRFGTSYRGRDTRPFRKVDRSGSPLSDKPTFRPLLRVSAHRPQRSGTPKQPIGHVQNSRHSKYDGRCTDTHWCERPAKDAREGAGAADPLQLLVDCGNGTSKMILCSSGPFPYITESYQCAT